MEECDSKQYLSEMPYIKYRGKNFDLQLLEEYKTNEEIIDFLADIMRGKRKSDKYGNIIHLKTWQDKIDFIDALKNSGAFKGLVSRLFTPQEQELLNIMLYEGLEDSKE